MFSSDSYDPVYEPIVVNHGATNTHQSAALAAVRKRTKADNGRRLLGRVQNIISIYIPAKDDSEEVCELIAGDDDRRLTAFASEDSQSDSAAAASQSRHNASQITKDYIFQRVVDLQKVVFELQPEEVGGDWLNGECIQSLAVVDNNRLLFFTIKQHDCLYKVSLTRIHDGDDDDDNEKEEAGGVPRGEKLYLEHKSHRYIPCEVMFNNNKHLFLSGYYTDVDASGSEVKKYLLIIVDFNGSIVHYGPTYDFERYGALSGDVDGRIFALHPQLEPSMPGKEQQRPRSGVSKLKADFREKSYCLFFGNERVNYRADYIAGHCAGDMTWVSCERSTQNNSNEQLDDVVMQRRLLAFNCCPPAHLPPNTSTKEWLKINSWNFGTLCPGPIAPLDDKLLVIDHLDRTLNYIMWPTHSSQSVAEDESENMPKLVRITKPDPNKRLWGITTCNGRVFMWTDHLIYQFQFNYTPEILESDNSSSQPFHQNYEIC